MDWFVGWGVATVALSVAWVTQRDRAERTRRQAVWMAAGESMGLTAREVEGRICGWDGRLGEVRVRVGPPKSSGHPDMVSWRVMATLDDAAALSAAARPDAPDWPDGPGPTTTGDPVFDREVVVHADSREVLAVLDGGRRARLRLMLDADTKVVKGRVVHAPRGLPTEEQQFVDLVRKVADHASLLSSVDDPAQALADRVRADPVGTVRLEALRRLFAWTEAAPQLDAVLEELGGSDAGGPLLALVLTLVERRHLPWLARWFDALERRDEVRPALMRAASRLQLAADGEVLLRALGRDDADAVAVFVEEQERVDVAAAVVERAVSQPTVSLLRAAGAVAGVDAVGPLRELALSEPLHAEREHAVARIQERSTGDRGGLTIADPRLATGQITLSSHGGELTAVEE